MSEILTFFDDQLVNALGWTFVHSLWQGCLIALLMMLVLQRISHRNAVTRYSVATASMLCMLVAAASTFALLYFTPGKSEVPAAAGAGMVIVGDSVSGNTFMSWLSTQIPAMVAVWIAGVVLLSIRLVFGLTYIQLMKNRAQDLTFRIGAKASAIARELGYSRKVLLGESSMVNIPVVVGYVKPMILFPVGAINQLTEEEVEAVLAHELAHLVRNDFIHNLIQSVIEILFYYHPAVWWISAVVRSERENCCDDLAIQVCGSSLSYARALVRLEEVGGRSPALALPFSGSKRHLLLRVKRILNQPQNKSNLMEKITATTLLLLFLIVASFTDRPAPERQDVIVPKLASVERTHYISRTFTDTLPPGRSVTEIREKTGEQSFELSMENGKVTRLVVDGETIPADRYSEYGDIIESMKNPPVPPTPPMPAEAPAPPSTPLPDAPPVPNIAPPPPPPPLPGMPPYPPAPPSPDMSYFLNDLHAPEIDVDVEIADGQWITNTHTRKRHETIIVREEQEDGSIRYHVEGDGSNVQIDAAAGVAIIDGSEIVLDSDSIFIIEEYEAPGMFAFNIAQDHNWDSIQWGGDWKWEWKWDSARWKEEWAENWTWDSVKWETEWKKNWNQEEWSRYWEKHGEEWQEYSKELIEKMQIERGNDDLREFYFEIEDERKSGSENENGGNDQGFNTQDLEEFHVIAKVNDGQSVVAPYQTVVSGRRICLRADSLMVQPEAGRIKANCNVVIADAGKIEVGDMEGVQIIEILNDEIRINPGNVTNEEIGSYLILEEKIRGKATEEESNVKKRRRAKF